MKFITALSFVLLCCFPSVGSGLYFCNSSGCADVEVYEVEYINGTVVWHGPSDEPANNCANWENPVYPLRWVVPGVVTSDVYSVSFAGVNVQWHYDCIHHTIIPNFLKGVEDGNDKGRPNCDCCRGMPVWRVTEPYMSLWLEDEPLGYQPPIGPRISLLLAFKQQDANAGYDSTVFSLGKKWNCSWNSYVTLDPYWNPMVHFPAGGSDVYTNGFDILTSSQLSGSTNTGFTVTYPDGSTDLYGFVVTNSSGQFLEAYLTQHKNASGLAITLNYSSYDPAAPVVRLQSIVDGNGLSTTIAYVSTNAFSTNLIYQVTDPFSRTATFLYDSSGRLTNITDVAGLTNSFAYDNNDWVTNLTTPYGQTAFKLTDNTDNTGTTIIPNGRSIQVTEPDGGKELFLFTNTAPGIPQSYSSSDFPNLSPYTGTTLDNSSMNINNSFHWGKRQFSALSTNFQSTGNVVNLTTNDFTLARMKHWLRLGASSVSEILSMERSPSADGTTPGEKVWYDYVGKTNSEYVGTLGSPLFAAYVLPDGSTHYARTDRNSYGIPTVVVDTYGSGSTPPTRTNTFAYSANQLDLITATNALGIQVSSNAYNSYHEVLTNYDAAGQVTVFRYNSNQQLTSVTIPSGAVRTNIYFQSGSASNALSSTIDYAVVAGNTVNYRTNSFTWQNDLLLTHTDPLGIMLSNTWDNLQRLIRIDYPDGTYITNVYNKLDLVQVIDRMGFSNSFGYDSVRHLVAATNADGAVTRYGYCSCGSLTAITNGFGSSVQAASSFSWDFQGHLLELVDPDGNALIKNYNAVGQVTNITDGLTSVTNWFNNQGLLVASSNAYGQTFAATLDVLDRATNTVNQNGVTLTNTFDNLSRLTTRGYPDGGVEKFGYTLNIAALTGYTNQLGSNVVNYTYDPLGRRISEVYPGIATNTFNFDAQNNLLTLTDGKSQTTTWHYNQYDRVTNKVDAAGNTIFIYQYDPNNRLTNRWTPAKGTTTFAYDALGNLTNITHPVSSSISLAYDVLNRLTNMSDAVGTTRYTYTSAGLIQSEDGPWVDDTVAYTYTSQRLRGSLSLQAPNASPWTQSYNYDASKRLTSVRSPAGLFGYTYDSTHHLQVSSLSLPNSAYITNTLDSVARLLSTVLKNNTNAILNSHSYGYNLASQIFGLTNIAGDYRNYTYDNVGELLAANGFEANGVSRLQEQLSYLYDPAGNLNWRTNNGFGEDFQVNNLNELSNAIRATTNLTVAGTTTSPATNVTVNGTTANRYNDNTFALAGFTLVNGTNTFTAVASDGYGRKDTNSISVNLPATNAFSYDLNGNLLSDGCRTFTYDDENQLISVVVSNTPGPSTRSDFVYDGRMRRRLRFESTWTGTVWVTNTVVRYVYDGSLVIQERDANNLPTVTYTRGMDLSGSLQAADGIGGLLAMSQLSFVGPQSYYYHADANGSITALISSNQTIVARYSYDPFGRLISAIGLLADQNLYRFASKESHIPSGLTCYLYRYYDARIQRWLNRDPIGERGGYNMYGYCRNAPGGHLDLFGLTWTANGYVITDYNVGTGANAYPAIEFGVYQVMQQRIATSYTLSDGTSTPYSTLPAIYDPSLVTPTAFARVSEGTGIYLPYRGDLGSGADLTPPAFQQITTTEMEQQAQLDFLLGAAPFILTDGLADLALEMGIIEGLEWLLPCAEAPEGTGATLALPPPSQVDYSWGALNTYREGGQMTAIEHINYRHAFDSGFTDVSRFAEGTSAKDIQDFVDQAARYGNVTPQGANGFMIEYNLGQTIGTGQAGEAASGIRVFIRNGQVQTAFPIAYP